MDPTARKGKRCPVCQKGAIVERAGDNGRYLGCSTFNPANPNDPSSDRTMWRLDGTMIPPKTNSKTLVFGLILSLVLFLMIFFVLTLIF
jgi:ssDNA-binding Zn-finger/Zn-ribbon topoisomerase 1